ncbi:hypothetical protein GCM10027347_60620 [Larkinella harenae]
MTPFEKFRLQIDLTEYAQRQGWQIDNSKSTQTATVLDKKAQDVTQDTIVVYKGPEHDYFYTPGFPSEKGDVIHFERLKNGADWKEIPEKLARYVANLQTERSVPNSNAYFSPNEAFQVTFKFQELTNTEYLEQQGLRKATIFSKEFQERIFNQTFSYKQHLENEVRQLSQQMPLSGEDQKAIRDMGAGKYYAKPFWDQLKTIQMHYRDTQELPANFLETLRSTKGDPVPEGATDRIRVNTAFPLRNEAAVVAVANYNENGPPTDQPKANAVWTSKTDFDERPIQQVVIHQSPLQALAYHQLNPPIDGEKRLYIATAGPFTAEQPVLVDKLIKDSQAPKVVVALTNDRSGIQQSINLAGTVNLSEQSETLQARLGVYDRTDARLVVTIHHQDHSEGEQRMKAVMDRFTNAINKNIPEGAGTEAHAVVVHQGHRTSAVEISFPAIRENLIRVEKILIQERGLENQLEVKRPSQKDYNEDLKLATPFIIAHREKERDYPVGRYGKELEAYHALSAIAKEKAQTAPFAIYTEWKDGTEVKKIELARYDRDQAKVVGQPEFEKRVEQQARQQRAALATTQARAGDVKVMDSDGNTVAKTEFRVEAKQGGLSTVQKEQRFDQDELQREGSNGKELQTAMNNAVTDATNRRGVKTESTSLQETKAEGKQEQENQRSLSR